jgi:putative ABC transport system permease protein
MLSRLRWNKVLRDAWRHKARSVLVVLSIAIGVAAFGMILAAREVAVRDMYAGFWANVPPNIILYTEPFDENLLPIVRKMPEVTDVEARYNIVARFQNGPDEWINTELTVLQDYDDSRISIVQPESGDWPPGRREMLLERSSLTLLDAALGDEITVEMPCGVQKELQVTGFAHEFNYFSSYISRYAHGYITFDTLEWLGEEAAYNQLYVTVAPDEMTDEGLIAQAYLDQVRNDIVDQLERGGYTVTGFDDFLTRPGKHWAYDFFSALMLVMGVVGALSLLLSGFLVMNTIMALLAQETRQIGVMKAVGAQRGQVMGIYLSTVLLYGGLALLIAVPLGLVCGRSFADFGSMVMNYDIVSYGLVPWVLGLQAAMALGVPAVSALFPVYAGTRRTVREAVSDYGIGSTRAGFFDRLIARVRGLPRPLMLSLRNTFRRKMRLALTLGALSLAGAIFGGVFSTRQSMLGLFDSIFDLFSYEVAVTFDEPVRPERVEAVAAQVPGVTRVESWLTVGATRVEPDGSLGSSLRFYGVPLGQETIVPTLMAGRWLLPEDGNAIVIASGLLRFMPDLRVGDEITFEIGDRESSWQIVGIVLLPGNGVSLAYANYPAVARASGLVGRATRAVVKIEDADNPLAQKTVARALEKGYERAGMPVGFSEVISETVANNVSQLDMVVYFLLMMAALLAVVGGLGLAATMSLNVLERTREIGVLRAIGASNRTLWGIIVAEGVLIGLISWVLGTLLSYPLGNLLSGGVGMAFIGVWTKYVFSYVGVWAWLAVVMVVSALASLAPARRASRISVREALAYE